MADVYGIAEADVHRRDALPGVWPSVLKQNLAAKWRKVDFLTRVCDLLPVNGASETRM